MAATKRSRVVVLAGFALAGFAVAQVAPSLASSQTASSVASSQAQVDPCALVTAAEASAALGIAVSEVENPGQCTYVAGDLSGRSIAVATLSGLPGPEYLEPAMRQLGTALQAEVRSVTGVGDAAFVVVAKDMSELMGVKGDRYAAVVLTLSKSPADAQVATLTQVAGTAFGRL
jgi:hypothetical protein